MKEDILARILALKTASLSELQKEYSAVYGDKKALPNNKTYLWQRIAYRIQELAYGSLQEEILLINTDKILQITERKIRDITKEIDWHKQVLAW